MSLFAIRLRPLLRSIPSISREHNHTYRLKRLCLVDNHNYSNVAFQADLCIDKRLLDNYVEEIVRVKNRGVSDDLDILMEKRVQLLKNISSLDSLREGDDKDEEMKKLLEEEGQQYSQERDKLNLEILRTVYNESHGAFVNYNATILEVSAGVGGQEAMLFAGELLNMYEAFATSQGWEVEHIEVVQSDLGGIKNAVSYVRGPGVYRTLRCEGGVHRVQRVPLTDKNARLHTSTATVVVMPEPTEIDVAIAEKDLKIETKRPSGPGGQNAQKTDSAVRITHVPTGIVSCSQQHRTSTKNIQVAMKILRTRLYAMMYGKQSADVDATRRQQEGSRMRSEKIRTYNILQDRVTDHRWGTSFHNLPELWNGGSTLLSLIEKSGKSYEEYLFKDYLAKLKTAPSRKK